MSETEQGTTAIERSDVRPAVLGVTEAARYIGMSVSWLNHSDVPRVRLGRRSVRFLITDLDAYLHARRSHGAAA